MKICVYAESCIAFTSGTPSRGMLIELINISPDWEFIIVFRVDNNREEHVEQFINSLLNFSNVKVHYENTSRKVSNIKNLLGFRNYNSVGVKADVYITFDIDPLGVNNTPLIGLLADLSSIKTTGHSSLGFIGRRLRRNALKALVKQATRIVCISDFTKNDLLSIAPKTKNKVVVILNGIMPNWFNEKSSTESPSYPYWIWYGWMSERKNLINLLLAYKIFVDNCEKEKLRPPSLKLIGGGKIEYIKFIKQNIEKLGLENLVSIEPSQQLSKLISLVDKSSGLVFPSFYEGFGLPIVEALARGKEVLTSQVTAMKSIAHSQNVLVDPNSISSIKEGLDNLFTLENKNADIYRKYARKFSYEESAKQYRKLIEEVANA